MAVGFQGNQSLESGALSVIKIIPLTETSELVPSTAGGLSSQSLNPKSLHPSYTDDCSGTGECAIECAF